MVLLGFPVKIGIFASFEAMATLGVTEDEEGVKQIGVTMGEVTIAEVEVASITEDMEALKPVIEDLIKVQLIEGLLGQFAGGALGGFPIPSIDLSSLDESLPAGTTIDITLEALARQYGYTVVDGYVD
jgi:hypothetical protein